MKVPDFVQKVKDAIEFTQGIVDEYFGTPTEILADSIKEGLGFEWGEQTKMQKNIAFAEILHRLLRDVKTPTEE